MSATEQVDVMKGRLEDYGLLHVLEVVSIGRQYTGIQLTSEAGETGTIFAKAGHLIAAEAGGLDGAAALRYLLRSDYQTFRVFRLPTPPSLSSTVGRLDVLLKMTGDDDQPSQATPATGAQQIAPVASVASRSVSTADTLTTQRQRLEDGRRRHVAVMSPKGGVGKTTIALHLAVSLARQGHRTVLVDADINGDVMSWLDARDKPGAGVYDALLNDTPVSDHLLPTSLGTLKILPPRGRRLPPPEALLHDLSGAWERVLAELNDAADIIIIDTPAGMYGPSYSVLKACSHILGVLQAEAVAARSFEVFREFLAEIPNPPQVVGVVLNMLQAKETASLDVLSQADDILGPQWLFDLSIPRNAVFLRASHEGVPLGLLEGPPPAAAWLFNGIAAELANRLGMEEPQQKASTRLLL